MREVIFREKQGKKGMQSQGVTKIGFSVRVNAPPQIERLNASPAKGIKILS
jgi:hypothetical protein